MPDNPQYADIKCRDSQSPCILWTGAINQWGYGVAHFGNSTTSAHRAAWIRANGPLDDDLVLDHLCRNRLCVNLDHLEPVTQLENLRRTPNFQKTHCPQGHPLTGHNLYTQVSPRGYKFRSCRACRNERSRKARQ